MILFTKPTRHRAVSMELAAYLDERYVEMHVVTEAGEKLAIVCDRDSILAVQRHIEKMARECPEIATWKSSRRGDRARVDQRGAERVTDAQDRPDANAPNPGQAWLKFS